MNKKSRLYHVFAISDSKGLTVEMVVNVALAQFRDKEVETHLRPGITTIEMIDEVIEEARVHNAMLIHSFVKHELADYIWYEGRLNNIEVVNILGPLLNRFSNYLHSSPIQRPGLFTQLNKEYFRRIATTEFALRHDDGAHADELMNAEIVLLGVSRTFKTPLCVYMAYKGWMVANIPVVLGVPLPDIVYKLPPERVYCLTTNPTALSRLRNARNEYLKGIVPKYASYENVTKELRYANSLYNAHPDWAKVKVTAKPIEEIANNIIRIYRKKQKELNENSKV